MKQCIILVITLMTVFLAKAEDIDKEKVLSRSYDASGITKVNINTSYGDVTFESWDQNTIEITATIKVSGKSEENVLKRFNSIDVEFEEKKQEISAKTTFGNSYSNKTNMSVDYVIKMPKNLSINLNTNYCDIYVNCSIQKGSFNLNYSTLNMENTSNELVVNANYSDIITNSNIANVTLNCNYSDSKFNSSVEKIVATQNYSDMIINHIQKELSLNNVYSDVKIEKIDKDFKSIKCTNTYSDVIGKIEKGAKYQYKANGTYSEFYMPNSLDYSIKSQKSSTSNYVGYTDSDSEASITITNTYSEFKLTEI